MTKEEINKIIEEEIQEKYYKHFEESKHIEFKNETESLQHSKNFFFEIKEYYKKRKEELEGNDGKR